LVIDAAEQEQFYQSADEADDRRCDQEGEPKTEQACEDLCQGKGHEGAEHIKRHHVQKLITRMTPNTIVRPEDIKKKNTMPRLRPLMNWTKKQWMHQNPLSKPFEIEDFRLKIKK